MLCLASRAAGLRETKVLTVFSKVLTENSKVPTVFPKVLSVFQGVAGGGIVAGQFRKGGACCPAVGRAVYLFRVEA